MSTKIVVPTRSYELLTLEDLERLRLIAEADRQEFFARHPERTDLAKRLLCVALCQGAALHWVDHKNGIKDLDVWSFYADSPTVKVYPYRRRGVSDFGDPKFGQSADSPHFVGRRVDLLGRSIPHAAGVDPVASVIAYLATRRNAAYHLAKKAVVLLEPTAQLGRVIWPLKP